MICYHTEGAKEKLEAIGWREGIGKSAGILQREESRGM